MRAVARNIAYPIAQSISYPITGRSGEILLPQTHDTLNWWYERIDGGSVSSTPPDVTIWRERVNPTRNVVQGTGANRPADTVDGIDFNGSNQFLAHSNTSGDWLFQQNHIDIFLQLDIHTLKNAGIVGQGNGASGGDGGEWSIRLLLNGNIEFRANRDSYTFATGLSTGVVNVHIAADQTSNQVICSIDGTEHSSIAFGEDVDLDDTKPFRMGCDEAALACFDGLIRSAIAFKSSTGRFSSAEVTAMAAYQARVLP